MSEASESSSSLQSWYAGAATATATGKQGRGASGVVDTLTSFPEEGFTELGDNSKGLLNYFSTRVMSAASSVMQNVIPAGHSPTTTAIVPISNSQASLSSPYTTAGPPNADGLESKGVDIHSIRLAPDIENDQSSIISRSPGRLGTSPMMDSPLRYMQDQPVIINETEASGLAAAHLHKAPPTGGLVTDTLWEDSNSSGVKHSANHTRTPNPLSRSTSINTLYSMNPLSHLPGYSGERDDNSDTESVMSTANSPSVELRLRPLRSGTLGKEFWMKDENATECFTCGRAFTAWRRKHHCRICGQIFCSSCTSLISGQKFNYSGKMRVCKTCLELVDQYEASNSGDEVASPVSTQSPALNAVSTGYSSTQTSPSKSITGSRGNIEISYNNTILSAPKMAIAATRKGEALEIGPESSQRSTSIRKSDRMTRPRSSTMDSYPNRKTSRNLSFVSYDSDEDMNASDDSSEDEEAMRVFSALRSDLNSGDSPVRISHLSKRPADDVSDDSRSPRWPRNRTNKSVDGRATMMKIMHRRRSMPSSNRPFKSGLQALFADENINSLSPSNKKAFKTTQAHQKESVTTPSPSTDLNDASISHVHRFMKQLLLDHGLDSYWLGVLVPPLLRCSENIDLDIRGGDHIDIRHYVKLKRIPGGRPKDTSYIDGIVFSHMISLKSMPTKILQPKILLVTFPIEYAKAEQHFMSIEPVLAQEKEYLRKLVRRIVFLGPQILVTSEAVSGTALRLLANSGITVIADVKGSVISRIARYTRADILTSIDKLAVSPRLGTCACFEVKAFRYLDQYKTCLYFSGIEKELGCTIVLRGGDNDTLHKVKAVTEFMIYVVFNLKLETSLMRDQFVLIPSEDPHYGTIEDEKSESIQSLSAKSYFDELVSLQNKRVFSSSPFVHYTLPYMLQRAREFEEKYKSMQSENEQLTTVTSEGVIKALEALELDDIDFSDLPDSQNFTKEIIRIVMNERLEQLNDQWLSQKKLWEQILSTNPFMFSPMSHQGIVLLYSEINAITRTPCVGPEQVGMEFYGDTDLTIGQFVEQLCLTSDEVCSECSTPHSGHYRNYVNGSGRISVVVEKFQCRLPGLENTILMWSYCKKCEITMPVIPMSSATWKYSFGKYMELSFWSTPLSFRALLCPHNLYRDHVRHFGFHNMTVRFEYDSVDLLEILPPQQKIFWRPQEMVKFKVKTFKEIKSKVIKFWDSVSDRLNQVSPESVYQQDKVEECKTKLEQLKVKALEERGNTLNDLSKVFLETKFTEALKMNAILRDIQDYVVSWDAEFVEFESTFLISDKDFARITTQQLRKIFLADESSEKSSEIGGTIVEKDDHAKAPVQEAANEPVNQAIHEKGDQLASELLEAKEDDLAVDSRLKDDNTDKEHEDPSKKELIPPEVVDIAETAEHSPPKLLMPVEGSKPLPLTRPKSPQKPFTISHVGGSVRSGASSPVKERIEMFDNANSENHESVVLQNASAPIRPSGPSRRSSELGSVSRKLKSGATATALSSSGLSKNVPSKDYAAMRKNFSDKLNLQVLRQKFGNVKEFEKHIMQNKPHSSAKVASLAKHFDDLSQEIERERLRERQRLAQGRYRALPPVSKPIVEVFKNLEDAVGHASDDDDDSRSSYSKSSIRLNHGKGNVNKSSLRTASNTSETPRDVDDAVESEDKREPEISNKSRDQTAASSSDIKKEDSTDVTSIAESETTLNTAPPSRQEPSDSIPPDKDTNTIASLMQSLSAFWNDKSTTGWVPLEYPIASTEHIYADSDIIAREDEPSSLIALCLNTPDYINRMADQHAEESAKGDLRSNLERWMLKTTGTHLKYQFDEGNGKLSCKIFYAEQFDAFRRQCGCGEFYVSSLARCIKWDSSGGKSGSAFLKTLDDRLVVKQLSPTELDAFIEFAPSYFKYMAQAFFHDLPTALAKIFGLYQILIRNPVTGKFLRMDLIVMENLFYNRKMTRIFDLKGSMRNRHVQQTGRENEVLLDENMVEYIYESPLFVRDHAKRLLRSSLFNDTLFLAKMNVMDYSLVVGIDESRKLLVIGIIDFIRTFTWDKKLESWVKERGLVRSGVKEPTVVSPRQYKNRFREAMERYVLMVPDCWFIASSVY